MQFFKTPIEGSIIIEPKIFKDSRGYFFESINKRKMKKFSNINFNFVQENESSSSRGVLRGLHYQLIKPQGKLVRVISGSVLDVIVDLRKSSPSFGKYFSIHLSGRNKKQLWIPPGLAHGFLTKSEKAIFTYHTTDYYYPEYERTLLWDDDYLNINWELDGIKPFTSEKDSKGKYFLEADYYD